MNSNDNILIKSPCDSGKNYKNCCGRNQQNSFYKDIDVEKCRYLFNIFIGKLLKKVLNNDIIQT